MKKKKIPSPFDKSSRMTERSAVALLMHWMRDIIKENNIDLGPPDVETIGDDRKLPDIVIYESLRSKISLIFDRYKVTGYKQNKEYVGLMHLMAIRSYLVHLKPVAQIQGGEPERKICRSALNYLYRSLKIIDDPFCKGVYWTDVLMRKEVADWAVCTAKKSIEWLYHKTYSPPFGDQTLRWHCQLLGIKV